MTLQAWEHFFKPEVRNGGRVFVSKGQVNLMRASDTEAQAYIRTSSSFKVCFKSDSIDSPLLTASCTCPPAQKSQFCKHMWAVLVVIEDKNPDFLSLKTDLQTAIGVSHKSSTENQFSQKAKDTQAAYKIKQADYRKQQYQLQKQRQQGKKQTRAFKPVAARTFSLEVEAALQFFQENGFSLRDSMDSESIGSARKKLARIFHPDRGGSHDEIVELNKFTEILLEFSDI